MSIVGDIIERIAAACVVIFAVVYIGVTMVLVCSPAIFILAVAYWLWSHS